MLRSRWIRAVGDRRAAGRRRCSCSAIARSRSRTPKTRCGSGRSASGWVRARGSMSTRSATLMKRPGASASGSSTGWAGLFRSAASEVDPGAIGSFEIAIRGRGLNFPEAGWGRRTLRAEIVGFNPQPELPASMPNEPYEVYSRITGHTSLLLGVPDTLPAAQIVDPR